MTDGVPRLKDTDSDAEEAVSSPAGSGETSRARAQWREAQDRFKLPTPWRGALGEAAGSRGTQGQSLRLVSWPENRPFSVFSPPGHVQRGSSTQPGPRQQARPQRWGCSGTGPRLQSPPFKVTSVTTPKVLLCPEGLTKVLARGAAGPSRGH